MKRVNHPKHIESRSTEKQNKIDPNIILSLVKKLRLFTKKISALYSKPILKPAPDTSFFSNTKAFGEKLYKINVHSMTFNKFFFAFFYIDRPDTLWVFALILQYNDLPEWVIGAPFIQHLLPEEGKSWILSYKRNNLESFMFVSLLISSASLFTSLFLYYYLHSASVIENRDKKTKL